MVSVLRLLAVSAAALALWVSPAAADCTGQFGAGQICNNPTAGTAPPVPTANPSIGTASSVITFNGRVITSASTTARAGLNVAPGVAPTSPVNGDFWSTSTGFFGRVNGTTVGPFTGPAAGSFAGTLPITVTFPAGVVTYAFDYTFAGTFTAVQTINLNTASLPSALTGTAFRIGQADTVGTRFEVDSYGTSAPGILSIVHGRGTGASPTALQSGDEIGSFNSWGYIGASTLSSTAVSAFRTYASENFSAGHQGSMSCIASTPLASSTLTNGLCQQTGVTIGSPTGGDKGVGTLNTAGQIYINGTSIGTGPFLPLAGGTMVGTILFTDNTYDIGASGATRPRNLYVAGLSQIAGSVAIGGATIGTDALGVTGTATISGTVTGGAFVPTSSSAPSDGMYLNSVGQTAFSAGSTRIFFFNSTGLLMANAAGATLSSAAATATAPTMIPRRSDSGTGIGSSGSASLSLIATSIEQLRINNGSIYVGGAASGTNTAAVAPTVSAALSTGTATNPDLVFQTGVATVSGTDQATATTALTIKGETQALLAVGNLTIKNGTAIPAGGTQDVGYLFSSTAHFGTLFGSGAPSLSAAQGSIYLRSDGSAGTRTYVNTNGTTGWVALVDSGVDGGGANPTGTVGLSAVNGTATTFLRSDGAPALSQAIAPTWTAQHIWSQTTTIASATGAALDDVKVAAATTTITGNTGSPITRLAKVGLYRPTLTDASAVTVTDAATLYIDNSPTTGGSVTITNAWALLVGAGSTKLQATTISAALTYGGVTLSNSVTGTGSMVLSTSAALTTPNIGAATGTSLSVTGAITAFSGTAIPAGGTTGTGFLFSSVANFGVFYGSGAPTLSAAQGSLYLRSDGSFYYNNNGSTGWTGAGTGTVTSVICGTGLTGGTITSTGTCAVDVATTANIWAGTANKILDAANVFNGAGALQSCGGTASNVVCDFSAGFDFTFTATTATNYTLANPTNSTKIGQTGCIYLVQPGSGSVDTITFGTNWNTPGGVSALALTATLGAVDRVCYIVRTSTFVDFSFANNVSH